MLILLIQGLRVFPLKMFPYSFKWARLLSDRLLIDLFTSACTYMYVLCISFTLQVIWLARRNTQWCSRQAILL